MLKIRLTLLVILLSSAFSIKSEEINSSNILSGFTKFQADRIEKLAIDSYLNKLMENNYIKLLLPKTHKISETYSYSGQRISILLELGFQEDSKVIEQRFKYYARPQNQGKFIHVLLAGSLEEQIEIFLKGKKDSELSTANMNFKNLINHLPKGSGTYQNLATDLTKQFYQFADKNGELVNERIQLITKIILNYDSKSSYVKKIHSLNSILRLINQNNDPNVNRIMNYSLFLAELADASRLEENSAEMIANILHSQVDTANILIKKRMPGSLFYLYENSVFISSYWGAGFGSIYKNSGEASQGVVLTGPVGIEVKLGKRWGLMYSPIDLGEPILKELTEQEYDTDLSDLSVNGLYLTYSMKNQPLAYLIGAKEARSPITNEKEIFTSASITFDLPLAIIF